MSRIYLDHNATTPLHPAVLATMLAVGERCAGNPSSLHEEGRAARQVVEQARSQVAQLLQASPAEVVFTSGGTESNSTAIAGAARLWAARRGRPGQLISSRLEHPSVTAALGELAGQGHKLSWLPVDSSGRIDPADLLRLLKQDETALVSLALVNHELGNVYPVAELAALAQQHGALFHCDAVQAVGRIAVDVAQLGVDLLSCSAHKLFGPKGVGGLYVRSSSQRGAASGGRPAAALKSQSLHDLPSLIRGGGQEKGRRAGTENLLGIAGFGTACALVNSDRLAAWQDIASRRDQLEQRLLALPGARRNGDRAARAPNVCNLAFAGVAGELLFMNLDLRGIAISTGSACSSGSTEASPVLLALGQPPEQALEAVRFSLGPATAPSDLDLVVGAVAESLALVGRSRLPQRPAS